MSQDRWYDLLVRLFVHHNEPAVTPEVGAWLNSAVTAVSEAHPDEVIIGATADKPSGLFKSVRTVVAVPDRSGALMPLIDVLHPSGRFDALVDTGNPMKGTNLFPFLPRHVEGRALRAVGPMV